MKWNGNMGHYYKNLFRGVKRNRSSYIGAILIIALGVLILVAEIDVLWNLKDSLKRYYDEQKFSEVFVKVKGMPRAELSSLEELEGVIEVFGRRTGDFRMLSSNSQGTITLHVLAYQKEDSQNKCLFQGKAPEEEEICIGKQMANKLGLQPGDHISLIMGEDIRDFKISGTVMEPEYIYTIPPFGAQVPDYNSYDIACINQSVLDKYLGNKAVVNEIGLIVDSSFSFPRQRESIYEKFRSYGVLSLQERKDQFSHHQMQEQFKQLFAAATVLPLLFFFISAFMLYVVLIKFIEKERSILGTLKALGIEEGKLINGYYFLGLLIAFLGSVVGGVLSIPMEHYSLYLYSLYYNLPLDKVHIYWESRFIALFCTVIISFLGVFAGTKKIRSISPSEAMRAATPTVPMYAFLKGEKVNAWIQKFSFSGRMSIRFLLQNKMRNLLLAFSIAFPFALSSVIFSFHKIAEQMYTRQFTEIELYDMKLSLTEYKNKVDLQNTLQIYPEIYGVEVEGQYVIQIKKENRKEMVILTCIEKNGIEHRLVDCYGNRVEIPSGGILVNSLTAKKLGIHKGDIVEVEQAYFASKAIPLRVNGILEESFGSGCYMDINEFRQHFSSENNGNQILFRVHRGKEEEIKKKLSEAKTVLGIYESKKILESYHSLVGSMNSMMNIFSFLSICMGGVLIVNMLNILLRERKYELGTLILFGYSVDEIGKILCFEMRITFVGGVILGIPMSFLVKEILSIILSQDSYLIRFFVPMKSYTEGFLLCLLISFLAYFSAMQYVKTLDIRELLKDRE